MENKTKDIPSWIRTAYGPNAEKALSCLGSFEETVRQSVEKFYNTIVHMPEARPVIECLTHEEFSKLKETQYRYLCSILDPGLNATLHKKTATKIGLLHFCSGVPVETLAEASVLYTDIAIAIIKDASNAEYLKEIITCRFQYDLINQIMAYTRIQQNRLAAHEIITRQSHSGNLLDFIKYSLETLLESLSDEVKGVAVGNVRNGNYRHLFARGTVPFHGIDSVFPDYPTVNSPEIQEKWFKEQPIIVNSMNQSKHFPPSWQTECQKLGIRSIGLFVMHDLKGAPIGFLMVCSGFSSYFMNEGTLHYWQQLSDLIGTNFNFIENSNEKRKHRLADGLRFRQLLAQEKVEMYYQPIIDPNSGRTVKVEALARLIDGDKVVSPGLFLPAFGSNQLRDLFDIGLKRVMEDLDTFPDRNITCSINLPPEAMNDTAWLKDLPDQLERMGATPDHISLEIVESALSDDKKIQDSLFALKEAGYSLFLDDVGTGESSLLRLATLPVTGIKIDQRFVLSIQNNFEYLDLILSLWSLADQRGLECVAEGVENENIVDSLGSIGNLLLQGYAFARPMPAKTMMNWNFNGIESPPINNFPRSLYGWYSLHIARFFSIRNALSVVSDLLSIERLQDAENCPMHVLLSQIDLSDEEIDMAHRKWHESYTRFANMVQAGANSNELRAEMETIKQELRVLVEGKLHPNDNL